MDRCIRALKARRPMPRAAAERKIAPTLVGFITFSSTAIRRDVLQSADGFGTRTAAHRAEHSARERIADQILQDRQLRRVDRDVRAALHKGFPLILKVFFLHQERDRNISGIQRTLNNHWRFRR